MSVLIVDDQIQKPTADGRAVKSLAEILRSVGEIVSESYSYEDAKSILISDSSIECILLDWSLNEEDPLDHIQSGNLLDLAHSINSKVPIFLMARRDHAPSMDADVMSKAEELIWILEDTTDFIAGRVIVAIQRYWELIMPPFNKALMKFSKIHEYSWHTPGHTGGTAFLKSPVGREFFNYFGENLLRSDLSISVGELGSLLDHSGPIGESEKYAARVFGADRSYTVTNGTSTSNRVIFTACVTRDEIALVDRNCHKSIEQALTMTNAVPVYLQPSRNYLGIIGPIYPDALSPKDIKDNSLVKKYAEKNSKPVHAIITNSTYDGLCYHVPMVLENLGKSVDRIHFDEAWYGYARFNKIYKDRFGMHGDPAKYDREGPTLFSTTSTHKLLAALSQASFIHIRDGKNKIDHARFNESFMMHASTSPQYAIIASNEVSAAMMEMGGENLTIESIDEAIAFRQSLRRIKKKADWFFDVWNADQIDGEEFEDVSPDLLAKDPKYWVLHPGDKWHGFDEVKNGENRLIDDYCMLDPIKVSVITPGVKREGSLQKTGIPAMLVTAYLDHRGIIVEKTTDFTILFLFSMGVTKGKWGTLLNALLRFKQDYDSNAPLKDVLPDLVSSYPERYKKLGLHTLATDMFDQIKKPLEHSEKNLMKLQAEAFSALPKPDMTPGDAYRHLVHDDIELLTLKDMAGRVVATGVVPYPPGIPLLMPGENAGKLDQGCLGYLQALEAWDKKFPGFGHDIHGVENVGGMYKVYCVNKKNFEEAEI